MLLENLLPNLSLDIYSVIIYVIAACGTILLPYAIFLEKEKRQDAVFMIAGICLLIYSLYLGNLVFILATAGLAIASLVEFIEILIKTYKK